MKACERYLNAIHELVDGTLGPIRRTELELHLETCEACRTLAGDLQRISQTARALDRLEPPQAAWTRIASRLEAEGRIARTRGGVRQQTRAMLALAAALVLLVAASMFLITRERPQDPGSRVAAGAPPDTTGSGAIDPAAIVTSELELSEKHFQNALAQADAIVDPQTKAVLQKNWLLMTDALAESRKALEADPLNLPARQSFYDTLRQKIQFLQDTIALMNEMRQGNAAGAAQIVEGGKS